jgi:hypothetical protein
VHHPQFCPAFIHSSHDLAFAFKHLLLSVRKKEKQDTSLELSEEKNEKICITMVNDIVFKKVICE